MRARTRLPQVTLTLTGKTKIGIIADFLVRNFGSYILANTAQAKKRARQNESRRQRNTSARSMMRTSLKKVIKAIEGGNKTDAQSAYKTAVPVLDRLAAKNLIHKNKATRHKSRLSDRIKAM